MVRATLFVSAIAALVLAVSAAPGGLVDVNAHDALKNARVDHLVSGNNIANGIDVHNILNNLKADVLKKRDDKRVVRIDRSSRHTV
ncbi:hypothetical protein BD560DRAFT_392501 [Blakeslea trispora]|nr:hypothetical protein BD560DRAFT_392501 [Blakeslea trispora]